MWLLLAIMLPLARTVVHRLARAADRRDPRSRAARALHQADSTVTAVSRRASRRSSRSSQGHSSQGHSSQGHSSQGHSGRASRPGRAGG
jgi:hypothetical protein